MLRNLLRKGFYIYIIASLLIAAFQFSCSKKNIYKSEIKIPDGIWSSKKAAVFEPSITDTIQVLDINLNISNSNDYRYSNIWFFIKSVSPSGFSHIDTVEVVLAEEDGKWLGTKSSDLYRFNYLYQKQIRFPKPGKYIFEIFHGMRDLDLKGIQKIGFEIVKNKKMNNL